MKTIKLDQKTYDDAIQSCYGYIANNDSQEENDAYLDEIIDIQSAPTLEEKWSKFLNSGIFHDSEGKVLNITETHATITLDY